MARVIDDVLVVEHAAGLLFLRQSCAALVRLGFVLIALLFISAEKTDPGFVLFAAWGASVLLSLAPTVLIFALYSPTRRSLRPGLDLDSVRGILPLSVKNYSFNLIAIAPGLLLPIVIAKVLSFEASAYFYTAYMIAQLLFTIINSTNTSLFAHSAAAGDLDRAQINRILLTVVALILPAVVVIIGTRDLVLAVFGPTYVENASTLLVLLAVLAVPKVVTGMYTTVKRIRREFRPAFGVIAFCSITTLIGSMILMPTHGLTGVGIAHVACFLAAAIYCVYDLWLRPAPIRNAER
jgi:O-antigen/teichoic acid export membrane protein